MGRKYKFNDQDHLYFVSFVIVYLIDLLNQEEYENILLESWQHCSKNKGMELYGWCIITSHLQMITGTHREKLEEFTKSLNR